MTLYEQIIDKKPLLDFAKQYPSTAKVLISELKLKEYITDLKLGTVWDIESVYNLNGKGDFVFTHKLVFKETGNTL